MFTSILAFILLDSLQALIFNNKPIIGIETKCCKKEGILVDTYYCNPNDKHTVIKGFSYSCSYDDNYNMLNGEERTNLFNENHRLIEVKYNLQEQLKVIEENLKYCIECSKKISLTNELQNMYESRDKEGPKMRFLNNNRKKR